MEEKKECRNCIYYSDDEYGLLGRHYCSKFSKYVGDYLKPFYVSQYSSCDNFTLKATPKNSNFNKGSDCFLTSACIEYLGKADDCEELTALRAFRDGYMKSVDGGAELIKEYYAVAPKIVESVNASDKKDKYYSYINEVIDKCVKLIALNENEKVLIEYKFMVENLKKEFGI